MDPRTNRFLAGANLAARGLFQEVASTLDPRVLRVAIPWDPLPPQADPLVESHEDFPTPCWDAAFLEDVRALGRLEGIVKLLGMIVSPDNSRHFPDAIATDPTLRPPALYR
jgi:hypothetical protein